MAITLRSWAEVHREARAAKGWTQQQAADALGVSLRAIQTWEGGEKEPNYRQLRRCVEVYGVGILEAVATRALLHASTSPESEGRPHPFLRLIFGLPRSVRASPVLAA